jgi:hypothetical protein
MTYMDLQALRHYVYIGVRPAVKYTHFAQIYIVQDYT